MASFTCEVIETIKDIAPKEWDKVVGDSIAIRHSILNCYEASSIYKNNHRYFLLFDEEKNLQAVAVTLLVNNKFDLGYENLILGRLTKTAPILRNCFRPVLICGLIRGPGAPIVVCSKIEQAKWESIILDAMEEYSSLHKLSIAFSNLLNEQENLFKELKERSYYHALCAPEAIIKITWKDQESYLKYLRSISKNYHKCAKKEIARFRKSGMTITEWDGRNERSIYNLLKDHHYRKNSYKYDLPSNFLSILRSETNEFFCIYVAKKESKIVGVFIVLIGEKVAISWKIGIDHDLDEGGRSYFNLNFYNFLIQAPALNIEKIYYGNGVLNAKKRRGCEIEFTHFFYKPKNFLWVPIVRILFLIQKIWYQRKFLPYTF